MTLLPRSARERWVLAVGVAVVTGGLWFAHLRPRWQRWEQEWMLRETVARERVQRADELLRIAERLPAGNDPSRLQAGMHIASTAASAAGAAVDYFTNVARTLGVSVGTARAEFSGRSPSAVGLVTLHVNWSASPAATRALLDELEYGTRPYALVSLTVTQATPAASPEVASDLRVELVARTVIAVLPRGGT